MMNKHNNIKNTVHTSSIQQQGALRRQMTLDGRPSWQNTFYNNNPKLIQTSTGYPRGTESFWGASPAIATNSSSKIQSLINTESIGTKSVMNKSQNSAQFSIDSSKAGQVIAQTIGYPSNYLFNRIKNPTFQDNNIASSGKQVLPINSKIANQRQTLVGNRPEKSSSLVPKPFPFKQIETDQNTYNLPPGSITSRIVPNHTNPRLLTNKNKPTIFSNNIYPKPLGNKPVTAFSLIPSEVLNSSGFTKLNVSQNVQPSSMFKSSSFGKTPLVNNQAKPNHVQLENKKLMWANMLLQPSAVAQIKVNARDQETQNISVLTSTIPHQDLLGSSFHNNINKNNIKVTQKSLAVALNNSVRKDLGVVVVQPKQNTTQSIKKTNDPSPEENPGVHVINFSVENQQNKGSEIKGDTPERPTAPKKVVASPTFIQIHTNTSELALKNFLDNLAKFYILKKHKNISPSLNEKSKSASSELQKSNILPSSKNNLVNGNNFPSSKSSSYLNNGNIPSSKPKISNEMRPLNLSSKTTQTITVQQMGQKTAIRLPIKLGVVPNPVDTPATLRVILPHNARFQTLSKPKSENKTLLTSPPFQGRVITIKPVVITVGKNQMNSLSKAVQTNSLIKDHGSTNTLKGLPERHLPSSSSSSETAHYGIMGNNNPSPLHLHTTRTHIPGAGITRTFNGDGRGIFVRTRISNAGNLPSDYRRSQIPHPGNRNLQTLLQPHFSSVESSNRMQALNARTSFGHILPHSQKRYPLTFGNNFRSTLQSHSARNVIQRRRYKLGNKMLSYKPLTYAYKTPRTYQIRNQNQRKQYFIPRRTVIPYRSSFPLKLRKIYPYMGMKSYSIKNMNNKPRIRRRFLELSPRTRRRSLEIEGKPNQLI